jgi:hypothetical protein
MSSCYLAALKTALIISEVSPIYFLSNNDGTILIIGRLVFFDRAWVRVRVRVGDRV